MKPIHHTSALNRLHRRFAVLTTAGALAVGAVMQPALAQTATFASFQGATRNFPAHALRGTLVVGSLSEAQIDDKPLLLAPAFKLYNPQNMTIRANTVLGQKLTVNYVIEKSTGRLHAAWILNEAEAALKREHADGGSAIRPLAR